MDPYKSVKNSLIILIPRKIRKRMYYYLRSKFYSDIYNEIKQNELLIQDEIDFFVDLEEKHIRNLRVFLDRNAMLEALPKNTIIAEIGVAEGNFSEKLISITRPKKIHLIDYWAGEKYDDVMRLHVQQKFKNEIDASMVEINCGDSVDELSKFSDGYFDWVYIDTDHSYKTTVQELYICRSKVKENGIIAGHDYITGSWKSKYRYGVIEAVNEFCIKYNWEIIFLTHEGHRHLSYAIRKILD